MFTQTFVHNNEKYAVIEGTMSSIRTLNSKQNQLYIDGRMAVSTKAMNMFMNTHYSVSNGVLWATIRMFGDQAQKFLEEGISDKCRIILTGKLQTHKADNGKVYLNITVVHFSSIK